MRLPILRPLRPVLALAAVAFLVGTAHANIDSLNMFRNHSYSQTGNGNTLTDKGYFFSSALFSTGASDFTSVTMSYPGVGSPVSLIQQSTPTQWLYQTGLFATKAAMDTAFPTGTYSFNASGAVPGTASFNYSLDDYPQSTPFLTGTDYTSLQGMNAASSFNFHFSSFTTGAQANSSFIFFTIFDNTTNTFAFNDGFLAPTTTGLTLAANTLQAGHNYTYELDFSNRDTTTSPGANSNATLGYDTRTSGTFITAAASAPEPGSLALLLPVIGTAALSLRRRRQANAS